MSEGQPRNERGRFDEKVSEQDILKLFDAADEPILTARELADQLPISRVAVTKRLEAMRENDRVGKKHTGARAVAWWATVAPAPSAETLRDLEATEGELERDETVDLTDMKRRLGMDG